MGRVHIANDLSGRIIVSFPYDLLLVEKAKSIDGRRWHPVEKHWSFPNKDGILEKILKVFEGKEAQIGPTLKTDTPKVKETPSPLAGEGQGQGYNFEDLRRELVSRKYKYFVKTRVSVDSARVRISAPSADITPIIGVYSQQVTM